MSDSDWIKAGIDLLQAIISGLVVALAIFWLDERRAIRERRLSDFRIASNWSKSDPKVSLRNFDLTKTNLSGRNFVHADLESALFEKATLWGTNFSEANLRAAIFRRAIMVGVIFKEAMVYRCDFSKARIMRKTYPDFIYQPDFTQAVLIRTLFRETKIQGVSFKGANLEAADFTGAELEDCDFFEANLKDSIWNKVKQCKRCNWTGVKNADPNNFPSEIWEEIQTQNPELKGKK